MAILKKSMYVRCPIDVEYPNDPRDFAVGKIVSIDEFAEQAEVRFYDTKNISQFYSILEYETYSFSKLLRCKIEYNTLVKYHGEDYFVKGFKLNTENQMYYYYLVSLTEKVEYVCEAEIEVSFSDAYISPKEQMMRYEFQNPAWFLGRDKVNRTIHSIDSSVYGLKELAGCKIFLKPHQIKTTLKCLSEEKCRYMIADEVGMGKTIEAISVIKIFFSDKKNRRVLIVVPDALVEQWKTELAFKFKLFEGKNKNNNQITIVPLSKAERIATGKYYHFMIVDEVHKILNNAPVYQKILELSQSIDNVIMLSATPIQSRGKEYHKLLSLIQPDKYLAMSDEEFSRVLALQNEIIRIVNNINDDIEDLKTEIEETDAVHNDETEELFEEIVKGLNQIARRTQNKQIKNYIEQLNYESEDFDINRLEMIVAYICESYQLEKCVIRNRRQSNIIINERHLKKELSYDIEDDFNEIEYRVYIMLSEWIEEVAKNDETIDIFHLIEPFFSSSVAFRKAIEAYRLQLPDELITLADLWCESEKNIANNIKTEIVETAVLKDNTDMSRMMHILDYIEQECYDKKIILFTHFEETFHLYKEALLNYFAKESCAFFGEGMSAEELELNTYRFQNVDECHIMLSDETGGEGRNFQNADILLNIDLPWNANTLEQRIGRLDRIGRTEGKAVEIVSVFARNSIEQSLEEIWKTGLQIFSKSQSGLEIIMGDVDDKIKGALKKDFQYGLANILPEIDRFIGELEQQVKRERRFDLSAYRFQNFNRQIEKNVEHYQKNEKEFFARAMMSWAKLAGFRGRNIDEEGKILQFDKSSFVGKSAGNTMFIPPNMKNIINDKLNVMRNTVRILNGETEIRQNPNMIRGTFDRTLAIENDYLNFFAPGDEIFDSIVSNAVSSYKGKCSAISFKTSLNWKGFVMNFYARPNELLMFEKQVPVNMFKQYQGYFYNEIVTVFIPVNDFDNEEKDVKRCYQNLSTQESSVHHLGKRRRGKIAVFKEEYPPEIWREKVEEAYCLGKQKSREIFDKKINVEKLIRILSNKMNSEKATAEYFGRPYDENEQKKLSTVIANAFKNYKMVLDSVCYVEMIQDDTTADY